MATATVTTKFFRFDQNNSGGSFVKDDTKGIGPVVWIEALDLEHAISRALSLGIYFEGIASGMDCSCCGDRWRRPWREDGQDEIGTDEEYDFYWHPTVYAHRLDGSIERITAASAQGSIEEAEGRHGG